MKSYFQNIAAIASLCIVVILPIIIAWNSFFPWEEAIDELNKRYSTNQYYVYVGGSKKWTLKESRTSKDYFILPEFITVRVTKVNNKPVFLEELDRGFEYYLFGITVLLVVFFFIGIPAFVKYLKSNRSI